MYLYSLFIAAAIASPADPWHQKPHPGFQGPSFTTPAAPAITPFHPSAHHQPSKTVPVPHGTSLQACAQVSKLAVPQQKASPSATATVPAQLAFECVNSIPFNSSAAVALIDSFQPYLQWQTTYEYLKEPPAEYAEKVQPPYDFFANLDRIRTKAAANGYANEFEFGFDLYEAFQVTHDGHFVFLPDSSAGIFSWFRTTPLVSVSEDGEEIPKIYLYSDVLDATMAKSGFIPSPITEIDGQDSIDFLLNWSQFGSLQDRDALWNNMFFQLAQVSLGPSGTGTGTFSGGGRGRFIYPGPNTTLTFANGSSITNENFARVLVPFDGIQSGTDIYQMFFIPPPGEPQQIEQLISATPTSTPSTPTSSASSTTIPAPGFPSPFIREKNNLNSGYFLSGEGYDDVAVLSVASFVGSGSDELDFQSVNTFLINEAVKKGKTKIIVDVSANGGGTILQGYDLFKQFFPQEDPYGATRFRAHPAVDFIGQEISHFSGLVPRSLRTNGTVQSLVAEPFNFRSDEDINGRPFKSWAEKYGPHAFGPQPDNFTSIIRWNLSDVLTPDNSGGIFVSGYLERSNITKQPFAAENIVIMTDGYCASTCTIFSELMKTQGNVKFINMGGRPNLNITQAIGGVKGTNDFPWDFILELASIPFIYNYIHSDSFYHNTELGEYTDLPFLRAAGDPVVNARDGIRKGDTAETPLQFIYEEADCRILYTPEMTVDYTAQWKAVADTAFNGESHCIAGSGFGTLKSRHHKREARDAWAKRALLGAEHFAVMNNLWTGMGGITLAGDGIMLP